MNAEESTDSSAEAINPYWLEAQARLQSAGVSTSKPVVPGNFLYQAVAPGYQTYYPASAPPYVPTTMPRMPNISTNPYEWYATPPPPPPFRSAAPQQLRPQQVDNSRVSYNYAAQPPRPQRFNLSFSKNQNGNRFFSSNNTLSSSNNVDDSIGDPNSGFFLRGRHPLALKSYVDRALSHPMTTDERNKCEEYLYSKIGPLLQSGAVFHVRWESEPLPHEKNYELTPSWTPASKLKPNNAPVFNKRENRKPESTLPRSERMSGPDIPLIRSQRPASLSTLPTPIIDRDSLKTKKRKTASVSSHFDDIFDIKKAKSEKLGTNHTENWLEDWVDSRRQKTKLSTSLDLMSLQERSYRRKGYPPPSNASRLSRSFPKVLCNLGQGMVDEYFSRTEDKFDPNDCDEIIGTNYEIEKKFFRLTKKPDAAEIRPLPVLKKAFSRLQKIAHEDPTRYKYISDQLRSIRQDLTVQKIRDEFTVAVYEFHARLTLENKDLCEFNQCQSQLRHLYDDLPGCKNEYEFTAYRLLYYILSEDDQDILSLLNDLDKEARKSPSLRLAIKVHDAFLKGHHIRLFKLYNNPPRMCGNVMELFLDRERKRFVKIIKATYHPVIEVSVLSKWFHFSSENDFTEFMKGQGIDLQPGGKTEPKKW